MTLPITELLFNYEGRIALKICEVYNGNKSGTASRVNASIGILLLLYSECFQTFYWICFGHVANFARVGLLLTYLYMHLLLKLPSVLSLLPTLETAAVLGPYWFQSHFYDNCQNSCTLADWLVAIVCKSTDNKNDVRCNMHAFSMEYKANSMQTFPMLL